MPAEVVIPDGAFDVLRSFVREGKTGSVSLTFHFSQGALMIVEHEARGKIQVTRAPNGATRPLAPGGNGVLSGPHR
jgi:hypothetical protein